MSTPIQNALMAMTNAIESMNPDGVSYRASFEPGSAKLRLDTFNDKDELVSTVYFRADQGMNPELLTSMARFSTKWETEIPPLVRASVAAMMFRAATRNGDVYLRELGAESVVMPRRGRVSTSFILGLRCIADLMVMLANSADDEAVQKGIDLDFRYTVEGMSLEYSADEVCQQTALAGESDED